MNASSSPQRILLAFPILGLFLLIALPVLAQSPAREAAQGQDTIVLKNGNRFVGAITGVKDGMVRQQRQASSGVVESSVPLADVLSVNMQEPPELAQAQKLLAAKKAAEARPKLEALVGRYAGLPASWVPRATLLLVDSQLETGDSEAAERTLVAFQRAYPESAASTGLMRAKIAIARNNFIGAKPLLAPIIEQALQTKLSETAQSAQFGQAFYLMGRIREQEGDLPGALQDYLRTSVIFFADADTAALAQERADFLMNEKGVTVP